MEGWLQANYRYRSTEQDGMRFDFHSHAQFEVYCFHSGDCKYLIHHTIYDLKPGDILIMDGMTAHRANPSPHALYERSTVHFSDRWIKPVLQAIGAPEWLLPFSEMNNSVLRGEGGPEREAIYEAIREMAELEANEQNEPALKVYMLTVLMNIYKLSRQANERLTMPKSEKHVHVERTASYIQQHFQGKITLDDISKALAISKFYLSRVFKEMTGITVMDYVMECRLNKVKYELEMHPSKVLADIAADAGFESPAHFSRFFKKKTGLTPSQYRRKRSKNG